MLKKPVKILSISLCAAVLIIALPFQAMAKLKKLSPSAKVGDIVYFGRYEQDENTDNGKEKIEWQVLEKKGNKVLLISNYILDVKDYHKGFVDIAWEDSTIRKWLNKNFIHVAFNKKEKKRICKTEIVNKDNIKIEENGEELWHTKGGNNTKDKVFLLSIDEVEEYFDSEKERMAEVKGYTIKQLSKVCEETESEVRQRFEEREYGRNYWYWLRSPGFYQCRAALVDIDGQIDKYGNYVNSDYGGIRPVIWVNL